MKLAALLVLVLGASTATAAPDLAGLLEQRVPQELATEGIVLARLGVALDVEIVGDRVLISLVDQTTQRASASTKIDALPTDREAAVALVTQVAATLASQLAAPPSTQPPVADHQQEVAEQQYRRDAIGFGDQVTVSGGDGSAVHAGRDWYVTRGELKVPVAETEFYELVGRPDLAAAHRATWTKTRAFVTGGGVLLGVAAASGFAWIWKRSAGVRGSADDSCNLGDPGWFECEQEADAAIARDARPYAIAGAITAVAGLTSLGIALHIFRRHPVSETEAKAVTDEHNQQLRKRLGLPTAQITPYAARSAAGVLVSGHF